MAMEHSNHLQSFDKLQTELKDADNSLDDHWDAQDSIFVFTNSEGQPFSVDAEIATLLTMFPPKKCSSQAAANKIQTETPCNTTLPPPICFRRRSGKGKRGFSEK